MKRTVTTIALLTLLAPTARAQLGFADLGLTVACPGAAPDQFCFVNTTDEPRTLLGANFVSAGGHLSGDGKPFGFALANSPKNITLANILPPPVVVPAAKGRVPGTLPINVKYAAAASWPRFGFVDLPDLTGTTLGDERGSDLAGGFFPTSFAFPEPSSGVLLACALLGALGVRPRRTH